MTSSWSEVASRSPRSRSSARPHPPSAPVSTALARTWAQRHVLSSIPLGQTAGRMPIPPVWWSSTTRPCLPPFGLRPKVDVAGLSPHVALCARAHPERDHPSRRSASERSCRRAGQATARCRTRRAEPARALAIRPSVVTNKGALSVSARSAYVLRQRAEVVPPPPHCRQERPFVPQDDGKIGQVVQGGLPEPERWSSTTGGPARHT